MYDFLWEVAVGVVVAVIIALAVTWRRSLGALYQRRRILFAAPRLAGGGISNFFTSRNEYDRYREHSSLEKFVDSAKQTFSYVGVAFGSATGPRRLDETLRGMLSRGVTIRIYLIDPSSKETLDVLSGLYGLDRQYLKAMCMQAGTHFKRLRESLGPTDKQKFTVMLHSIPMPYSAFVFDEGTEGQRFLVDFKVFGVGKDHSFGVQFEGPDRPNTLYRRLLQSLGPVRSTATTLEG